MSIDTASYRRVIGTFATGVTVVTTATGGRLHGLTANAVTSVSLDPLLLLVCVDKDATAHVQLSKCDAFGVSILAEGQQEVSNLFAASGDPEPGRLRGVAYRLGESGVPLLEGAIASLECEVADKLDGGDHTIFIGAVLDGEIHSEAPPLIYYRGAYRCLDD